MDSGVSTFPIAPDNTPDRLVEYCLKREHLTEPIITSAITAIQCFRDGRDGNTAQAEIFLGQSQKDKILTNHQINEFNKLIAEYVQAIPEMDVDAIASQIKKAGISNHKIRAALLDYRFTYKFTILPIILHALCETLKQTRSNNIKHTTTFIMRRKHNAVSKYSKRNDQIVIL